MGADYTVDPDEMDGLPPMASPLLASGADPDQIRMALLGGRMPTASPSAAAPSAPAPLPASTPSAPARPATPVSMPITKPASDGLTDMQRQAFGHGLGVEQQEEQTANQEGAVPQEIGDLEQRGLRDQAAAPQPQDYKPSFGQRVVRGLRGALVGGLTGGIPGLLVGATEPGNIPGGKAYGAPTDAYDLAAAQNKQQQTADAENLDNARSNWKLQQDALKARQEALKTAGTTANAVGTGVTGARNATTDAAKVPILQQQANTDAYRAWAEGPDGKLQLTQNQIDQRTAVADRNRMPPGFNRTRFILTGQIQPAHDPSAEEIALGQATRAFITEHGYRPQTLAEYQSVVAAAKGGAGSGGGAGGADREQNQNLRSAASNAKALLASLRSNFSKTSAYSSPADNQAAKDAIAAAQKTYDSLQQQLTNSATAAPSSGETASPPSAHVFSRSAYVRARPKGDLSHALAQAEKQGYTIVP